MDLSTLAASETSFLHLAHPGTGVPLYADKEKKIPVGITLASTYSSEWRNTLNKQANSKRGKRQKPTAESSFEDATELLAAVTKEFHHLVIEGKTYTATEAAEVYAKRKMGWIRKQVDEHLGEDANFF